MRDQLIVVEKLDQFERLVRFPRTIPVWLSQFKPIPHDEDRFGPNLSDGDEADDDREVDRIEVIR